MCVYSMVYAEDWACLRSFSVKKKKKVWNFCSPPVEGATVLVSAVSALLTGLSFYRAAFKLYV